MVNQITQCSIFIVLDSGKVFEIGFNLEMDRLDPLILSLSLSPNWNHCLHTQRCSCRCHIFLLPSVTAFLVLSFPTSAPMFHLKSLPYHCPLPCCHPLLPLCLSFGCLLNSVCPSLSLKSRPAGFVSSPFLPCCPVSPGTHPVLGLVMSSLSLLLVG